MSNLFDPNEPGLSGQWKPMRFEGSVTGLEVEGTMPEELNGDYVRVAADPAYPPFHKNFLPVVDGDGMMASFRFREGRVDFRSRYVETERLRLCREANRALFGEYRNPYTDDPSVAGANRGAANTTIRLHAGVLWALKEDSPGITVDPVSLDTIGVNDFCGRMTSRTMTAHPRVDPKTGEMLFYGAAAKGETTPDIALYTVDAKGQLLDEQWVVAPYASMIHDWVVTERWIIIPVMPLCSSLERLKAGRPIYNWEAERGMYLGIMPRGGSADDIRWCQSDTHWFFHTMNGFDDPDDPTIVHMDVTESGVMPFRFMHADAERTWRPDLAVPRLTRWTVDTKTGKFTTSRLTDVPTEFPRIDGRKELGTYRHGFSLALDPAYPTVARGRMHSLAHLDLQTGVTKYAYAGPNGLFEEPQFVPRSPDAPEGDGWLIAMRHHLDTPLTDMVVYDAQHIDEGPLATAFLPFRVRPGAHGDWVDAA